METLLLTMLASLLVCAPPGPLGALCAQTAALRGRAAGLRFGLGIALGESVHASIAILGAFDLETLPRVFRVAAGLALAIFFLGLAWRAWWGEEARARERRERLGPAGAFLLALATPGTLPAYLLIFSAFGLRRGASVPLVAAGALVGSILWWSFVSCTAHRMRQRLTGSPAAFGRACGALFLLGACGALRAALS